MNKEQFEILIDLLKSLYPVFLAIMSILLTALLGFFTKRIDFANDYFKLIIGKRLKAYESIEKLMGLFLIESRNPDGKVVNAFLLPDFIDQETGERLPLVNLLAKLNIVFYQNEQWLSKEFGEMLKVFLQLCSDIDGPEILHSNLQHNRLFEDCLKRAIERREDLDKSAKSVMKQFHRDFASIHDVTGFLKEKNENVHIMLRIVKLLEAIRRLWRSP